MNAMLKPISREKGMTPGERELAKIADLSFFGLWSYPSVHRKMVKGGNTLRHEVADLIVVFGKDILLFSEKDIKFPESGDVGLSWKRWFQQSISKSVSQLRGAERYIRSSGELFIDAKCTQPFPFELNGSEFKIHLVAICRNSIKPASAYFDSHAERNAARSTGSLVFMAPMREQEMADQPFTIGDFDPNKTFAHVFDESAIELLLTELDAGPDFINYLNEREAAIRKKRLAIFYGEEDFLAVYLSNTQENGFGHYETDVPLPLNIDDYLPTIEEGMWCAFLDTNQYSDHTQHRKSSGFWKKLTDQFSEAILSATVGEGLDDPLETHERAIRAMASENRISRALLGQALLEKFHGVPTNARSARLMPSLTNPKRIYVFLLFPWADAHETYQQYRAERRACMELYAHAAQLKYPAYSEIVILGADTKNSSSSSETVLVAEGNPEMTEEQRRETQAMMDEHQILVNMLPDNPYRSHPVQAHSKTVFGRPKFVPQRPPGVNDPCHCGSGKKYKKCCRP